MPFGFDVDCDKNMKTTKVVVEKVSQLPFGFVVIWDSVTDIVVMM